MTAYLADTHIVLWAIDGSPKLPTRHRKILHSDAIVFVSAASLWEMTIKASLGKLDMPEPITENLALAGFSVLDIKIPHLEALRVLPRHHGDPFDRLLIAQAQVENIPLMTVDRHFSAYRIPTA